MSSSASSEIATPTGSFRWVPDQDRWVWSAGMYAVHGYPTASILPSTAVVLSHKLPADRSRAAAMFDLVASQPMSYSFRHHIVDTAGRIRTVLTVGGCVEAGGRGLISSGYMVDLTDAERASSAEAVSSAFATRALINQAQGAVMAVYGLDADAALGLLVWYSNDNNVRLADIAQGLVTRLRQDGPVISVRQFTDVIADTVNRLRRARRASSRD
jgi:hypothetical protein